MFDGHLLVLSIGQQFSSQSVMFDVVDCLQVKDGEVCLQDKENNSLQGVEVGNSKCESNSSNHTENSIVQEEGFLGFFLHKIDAVVGVTE